MPARKSRYLFVGMVGAALLCLSVPVATPLFAQAESEEPVIQDVMSSDLSDEQKIAEINRLLALNPQHSDLYNNLGVIYAEREEWIPARDAFIAAVQSDPRMPEYHRNLGMVLNQLDMPEMAVAEYEAFMRLSAPGGLEAYRLIGDVWRRAGNVPAALAAYREGIEAFGNAYNEETAQMVMAQVLLLEEAGDTGQLEALLDRWAGPASQHLAANGGSTVDQIGMASKAIISRLLVMVTDNAKILSESGLHAQAAEAYERAMEIDPSREDLLPIIASEWLEAGDTMKAKVMARRTVMDHPEKAAGWRAMGRIADAENRYRDAIDAYVKALDIEPDRNDLASRIGTLYLKIGDNANARKYMGQVVSDPETPINMIYNYALSLQRSKDFSLSVPPLRKVVEREPAMAPAWQALATGLRMSRQYVEAAEAYRRCLALNPDPKHAFQMGYCLSKVKRYDAAAAAYERALEIDPTYEKSYYNLGLSLMKLEDYEAALEIFDRALEHEPDSYRLYFNMGLCHYNLKNDEKAVEYYDLAMEQKETSGVWTNMGMALDRLGEKAEANKCFKRAKALKAEGR